jgi:hypothetical protein
MKIITVINNQNNFGLQLLRLSCALNGLDLVILVSRQTEFASNRIKDDLLYEYLDNNTDPDEVICFSDGLDAVFMANGEEILSKFNKTGMDLLFSCESACWPDPTLESQYPVSGSPYKFLNSGGFIGKAGVIKELMKDKIDDPDNWKKSNQYVWTKRYFKYPHVIGLDRECNIFHTFSPEIGKEYLPEGAHYDHLPHYLAMKQWFLSNFIIRESRIFSKITNTWPCHAHFNGFSKCLMDYDIVSMVFSMIPGFKEPKFVFEPEQNEQVWFEMVL